MKKKNKKILSDSDIWNYAMSETQIIPKKKLYKENYKKNHTDNENKITLHVSSKKNNKISNIDNIKTTLVKKKHLKNFEYTSVDKSLIRKIKKGELLINDTLDLHGLNKDEAYKKLSKFVDKNYYSGNRYLLVITGKGNRGDLNSSEQKKSSIGILRKSLPIWLDDEKFKKKIISHKEAFSRHGGRGARYIIIRKNKKEKTIIK